MLTECCRLELISDFFLINGFKGGFEGCKGIAVSLSIIGLGLRVCGRGFPDLEFGFRLDVPGFRVSSS